MNHWDNAEIRFRREQVANFEQSFLYTARVYTGIACLFTYACRHEAVPPTCGSAYRTVGVP